MKFLNFFILFSGLFLAHQSFAGSNGGASVVGDGGYIVICDRGLFKIPKITLFDLYEYRVKSGEREITLSGADDIRGKVKIALDRATTYFHLNPDESARLAKAAVVILGPVPLDPWLSYPKPSDYFWDHLEAQAPLVDAKVLSALQAEKCQLEVTFIKPDYARDTANVYKQLCNGRGGDFCLLQNSQAFRRLHPDDRACMVLHEALRFLPAEKRPTTEAELRDTTARLCTE